MKKITGNFEDIIGHFYQFNMNEYDNKMAKSLNSELEKENQFLKGELKKLEREFEILKNNFNKKNDSFSYVRDSILKDYPELSQDGLKSLATAEYLFSNEKLSMDYSPIYMNYVKTLELEIKSKLNLYDKSTFGNLIEKLDTLNEFKTFIKELKKNRVIEMRNRAIHVSDLKKSECGKIRNMLFNEGWLSRLLDILHEVKEDTYKEVDLDIYILDNNGWEYFNKKSYFVYETLDNQKILSNKNLQIGTYIGKGKIIEKNNISYIFILKHNYDSY